MDKTFEEFIAKAKRLGLCQEYTDKVDKAKSKKAFMDICLDANGMPWVARSIAKGWGLTAEYICREYAPFNNGKYVRDMDGYTSAMYCLDGKGDDIAAIRATTTALIAIDFIGTIYIPKNRICEMHLVNCKCYIKGDGKANVYIYGEDADIYDYDKSNVKIIRDEL
jgi:hypothetical protein